MKACEIKNKITELEFVMGECAMQMNPLDGESGQNKALCDRYESAEREIERLEQTLAVRSQASALLRMAA